MCIGVLPDTIRVFYILVKKLQIIIVLLPNSVYSGLQNSSRECGLMGVANPNNFHAFPQKPKSLDRTLTLSFITRVWLYTPD